MAYIQSNKKVNLFSAISIGVSCIVGSGWLFASYKAAKFAGPISIISWVIGAVIAMLTALLLAEISTIHHKETGLLARLLTITHNKDYGFIVSSSNWFAAIVAIPAEAEASMQYLVRAFPQLSDDLFKNDHFTALGTLCVFLILIGYGALNYWGIKLLAKANNIITVIKLTVPALTAIIIFAAAFHSSNFSSYHNTIAPYGYSKVFTAVVTCGIFYSFYGFSMITLFAKELDNPQRNIPLALGGSIIICLIIYLMLQVSFLGAIDAKTVSNGWHTLDFTSPLSQLAVLIGINWLSLILYVDAVISPSGTGVVYVGSSARIFTGMAEDKQMPSIFAHEHPVHNISRLSILVTLVFCTLLVVFFDNWDKIMIVVSVFQILSCLAVPIAFSKIRRDNKRESSFRMPFGLSVSYITFMILSYLLVQCGTMALVLSFIVHTIFFIIYCSVFYKNFNQTIKAFASSWSIFVYIAAIILFGFLQEADKFNTTGALIGFFVFTSINFYLLVNQKTYNK